MQQDGTVPFWEVWRKVSRIRNKYGTFGSLRFSSVVSEYDYDACDLRDDRV